MQALNVYVKFLEHLNSISVRYAVLHDWQSLARDGTSDLDVVTTADDLRRLEASLHQRYQILTMLRYEVSSFYFVLADKVGDEVSFISADFATDYRLNGRVFFTDEELLRNRQLWRESWVVGPSQEFAYLLVKKIYDKGFVPEHQRTRIKELAQELGQKAYRTGSRLFGEGWGNRAIDWVIQERWTQLEASIKPLRRGLRRQVMKRDPLNSVRYWLPEAWRVWQRWRYPTGLLVAVLGPDGCGKSTLIQRSEAMLVGPFRRTVAFHLRPRLIGWKANDGPVTDPHGKPPYSWWLSLLKISYYVLEYGLGYLLQVRPCLVRSTLVLFDRYYDDLLVDPPRYRYGGPPGLVRLARRLVPRPNLVLIIDAPEDQLLARKREVLPEELRRQRAAYRRLAAELPNSVLLDGSSPAAQVAQDACKVALDYLHARYLKRRHLWFRDDGSEIMDWLSSALFSGQKARLTLSNPDRDDSKAQWERDGSFGRLALKDGRGYLIPLDSRPNGVNALRLYNAQNFKARFVKRLLMMGLKAGITWPLLRRVQVIIRRHLLGEARSKISLLEHLREIFGDQDLTFAISLGTPGPHRKPVVQVLTKDCKVLGYVKVGWNEATNALVQNEAAILKRLGNVSFTSFTIPAVLYTGWWQGRFLCVQSAPEGKLTAAPQRMTSQYLAVLQELRALHTRWLSLQESVFWTNLARQIENIQSAYYGHVLQQGISRAEEWLGHQPLPFHCCHGDFAPWNVYRLGGRQFLFDWEYASLEAPPGWDLLHFLIQTLWLIKKWSPLQIYRAIHRDEVTGQWVKGYLESLGLGEDVLEPLLLLYLLERLAFYALKDPTNFQKLRYLAMMVNLCIFEEKSF